MFYWIRIFLSKQCLIYQSLYYYCFIGFNFYGNKKNDCFIENNFYVHTKIVIGTNFYGNKNNDFFIEQELLMMKQWLFVFEYMFLVRKTMIVSRTKIKVLLKQCFYVLLDSIFLENKVCVIKICTKKESQSFCSLYQWLFF